MAYAHRHGAGSNENNQAANGGINGENAIAKNIEIMKSHQRNNGGGSENKRKMAKKRISVAYGISISVMESAAAWRKHRK